MSDTITPSGREIHRYGPSTPPPGPGAWQGWVVFAGVMLIMVGAYQAVIGITALLRDDFLFVAESGLALEFSFTAWGWVHLIFGVVAVATGSGLLGGRTWARILAVAIAVLSMLVNFAFLPAHPVWSLLVIVLNVIIIYAIAVHGGELARRDVSR